MNMNNFQINVKLRKDFKKYSYIQEQTMRESLTKEVDEIILYNQDIYKTKPLRKSSIGNFTINLEDSFKQKMKEFAKDKDRTVKDLVCTAMLNFIKKSNPDYNVEYVLGDNVDEGFDSERSRRIN